jgi:predicted AlkP superfamily phosphohydrolase/phosphomutase
MRKRKFLFLTLDGITYSSCNNFYPDVENLQVLGWAEGINEKKLSILF